MVVPSGVDPDADQTTDQTDLKCSGNEIIFTFPTATGIFKEDFQSMHGDQDWGDAKIAAFQKSIKNRFGCADNIEKKGMREVRVKMPYQLDVSPVSADFKYDIGSKLFTVWARFRVQEDERFEKINWGVGRARDRENERNEEHREKRAREEAIRERAHREAQQAAEVFQAQARAAAEAAMAKAAEAEANAHRREQEAASRMAEMERRWNAAAATAGSPIATAVHRVDTVMPPATVKTEKTATPVSVTTAVGPVPILDPMLLKLLESQMHLNSPLTVSPSKRHAEFQFTEEGGGTPTAPKSARHNDEFSEYFSVGSDVVSSV